MKDQIQIVIAGGEVRFIHDDDLAEAMRGLGTSTTARASRVEPTEGGWKADLAPVQGPVLGPFPRRSTALEAEVEWLQQHRTPKPQ